MATQTKARILLVDDDAIVLDSLGGFLAEEGYEISTASEIPSAKDALTAAHYNLVITDVSMPTCDGLELLRYVRQNHPQIVVILMSRYGTIESAVEAIKQGAYDYLTKPIIDDDIRMAIRRALQQQELLAENRSLKEALAERRGFSHILTSDARMMEVLNLVEAVSGSPATVLITGESGTGKSRIARAIHTRSPRRDAPFVEVACGALPDTLLESELFGYVAGAFTHAQNDRPGKFAAAHQGTIFLDEIATASPQLQVKLLRVLQDRSFEPLGSNETIKVDVLVVLATNHDLWAEVQAGGFRSDLYYRINVVNIELPPLLRRIGDIPLLAEHFLNTYAAAYDKKLSGFTPEAIEAMQGYLWPGNVRELENCVERAVVLCRSGRIDASDLPPAVLNGQMALAHAAPLTDGALTLAEALADSEKKVILAALERRHGSRNEVARELGINRTTLYKKMRRYDLLEIQR